MNIAVPAPDFILCKHTPQLFFVNRRLDLNSENLDGDFGEDGAEDEDVKSLGVLLIDED